VSSPDPARRRGRARSVVGAVEVVYAAARGSFVAAVSLFAVSSLGMVALLFIGNRLLQELLSTGSAGSFTGRVWWLVAAALVIGGVVSFAGSAAAGMHRLLVERVIRYYGEITLRVSASVPLREFDSPEFHDRMQRAKSNQMAPMQLALAVPSLLGASIGVVGVAIGLATVSPWLVGVTLIACIPLWFVGRNNSESMYSFSFGDTPNDRMRFNIERVVDDRRSAPEVRAFSLADFLLGRWARLYDDRIRGIRSIVSRFVRRSAIGSAVGTFVIAGVFAAVYVLVSRGSLSIGAAATASVAVLLLANRGQQVATNLAQMLEQGLYVDDLLELRRFASTVGAAPTVAVHPFARLTADKVTFSYPSSERPALADVSFGIAAGEVIAVVGRNGSGKTTLAKLLCGLYEPSAGSISWDDRPIGSLTRDGGLSEVGAVFQDFGRYWFSAADNIAIGDVSRLDDRAGIEDAATRAGASEFIDGLPNTMDTPLAVEVDGGVDISGGQWQRIAIARVLFRDASFIVLDEPTASLDAEAEAELFTTIEGLREGRTVVIISHRFSTVRSADRILVLHDGELVEQGSHDALMREGGRYARMYALQAESYVAGSGLRPSAR
jgi:ATP-binding cassette subfamily B protein